MLPAFSHTEMMRSALITGATGFVGSHLAEHLTDEGWRLRALVRPTSARDLIDRLGVEPCIGDLTSAGAIRGAAEGVDTVYHLAAVTFAPDEESYQRANAAGTQTLVDAVLACAERPRRLVYLSSYAACGPATNDAARRTDETPAPISSYGRSKLEGERIVEAAAREGIEVVVVRAPAVYGPGDRALLSYFQLVRWGLAPSPAGSERRRLHMIYAPDLARALGRAAVVEPGIYPVAEPVEHPWPELIATIARAMERRPVRLSLPTGAVRAAAALTESFGRLAGRTPAFNREKAEEMLAEAWTCDLSGSAALLSPADATPLAEGIARTVQWYKRQRWL
jgi:dihydroflavonol-4-reductase